MSLSVALLTLRLGFDPQESSDSVERRRREDEHDADASAQREAQEPEEPPEESPRPGRALPEYKVSPADAFKHRDVIGKEHSGIKTGQFMTARQDIDHPDPKQSIKRGDQAAFFGARTSGKNTHVLTRKPGHANLSRHVLRGTEKLDKHFAFGFGQ